MYMRPHQIARTAQYRPPCALGPCMARAQEPCFHFQDGHGHAALPAMDNPSPSPPSPPTPLYAHLHAVPLTKPCSRQGVDVRFPFAVPRHVYIAPIACQIEALVLQKEPHRGRQHTAVAAPR